METKKTSGEQTLSVIGNLILALGLLAAVVILFSIFTADNEDDGFNWSSLLLSFYLAAGSLLAWALCKILVEIAISVRTQKSAFYDWKKDFALKIALNKKDEAKAILYSQIFKSTEFENYMTTNKIDLKEQRITIINNVYGLYLKEVGDESFNVDTKSEIWKVFEKPVSQPNYTTSINH